MNEIELKRAQRIVRDRAYRRYKDPVSYAAARWAIVELATLIKAGDSSPGIIYHPGPLVDWPIE